MDWTGLPPGVPQQIAASLPTNAEALLSLASTCRFWKEVSLDSDVWLKLLLSRYGQSVLPKEPAPRLHSTEWTFFQGVDSSGGDCQIASALAGQPAAIKEHAEKHPGSIAFNTDGAIKTDLKEPLEWNHTSFEPGIGLYVRTSYLSQLGNFLPRSIDGPESPPCFPGWTFFCGYDSPGFDLFIPRDHVRSLNDLAAAASQDKRCQAFTTRGVCKSRLWPQSNWVETNSTWHGIYVRNDVVTEMQLKQLTGSMALQRLYFRHASLRKLAPTDISVLWLNGQYLSHTAEAGGSSLLVVELRQVCWLDLTTTFRGVLPGQHRLVWRMKLKPHSSLRQVELLARLVARRDPERLAGYQGPLLQGTAQEHAGVHLSGITAAAAAQVEAAEDHLQEANEPEFLIRPQMTRLGPSLNGRNWFDLSAGEFELPPGRVYDIEVSLRHHSGSWKSGALWDYVELQPLRPNAADMASHAGRHVPLTGPNSSTLGAAVGMAPPAGTRSTRGSRSTFGSSSGCCAM